MARRKNRPETVRVKCHLSERLRDVRTELYGERGGSEMARQLNVPIRTWYNYESGVTVPAEVLLRFMELTSVEPLWLLHGRGPKFRSSPPPIEVPGDSHQTVRSLLRSALQHLESRKLDKISEAGGGPRLSAGAARIPASISTPMPPSLRQGFEDAQHEWLDAEREGRCLVVDDDAMTPIVADGARVAYSPNDESVEELDEQLVVAWTDGRPQVRWFRLSGSYGLLRAENPDFSPSIVLTDLAKAGTKLRRVLCIGTPH